MATDELVQGWLVAAALAGSLVRASGSCACNMHAHHMHTVVLVQQARYAAPRLPAPVVCSTQPALPACGGHARLAYTQHMGRTHNSHTPMDPMHKRISHIMLRANGACSCTSAMAPLLARQQQNGQPRPPCIYQGDASSAAHVCNHNHQPKQASGTHGASVHTVRHPPKCKQPLLSCTSSTLASTSQQSNHPLPLLRATLSCSPLQEPSPWPVLTLPWSKGHPGGHHTRPSSSQPL